MSTCRFDSSLVSVLVSFLSVVPGIAVGGSGVARAQGPQGASTPLPLAVELKKVPVGSWSEYRIADGQNTMNVRMALVARGAKAAEVETEIKGGPIAALGRTTMRMSVPLDDAAEVQPKEQVIQLGENPPMFLPAEVAGLHAQSFRKLDPKKRIGFDDVKVPGGNFPKAEHYQDKGASGETVDFWINKSVLPFGLVKVTSLAGPGGAAVAMELTGHGAGARPVITKKPQPFDAAAIMKQAQPAMAGARPGAAPAGSPGTAGGPPLRPVPSPHPGMPATSPESAPASSGAAGAAAKDAPKK